MNNKRKIHWKSWNVLTQAKKDGGMGFRDLRNFNLAMLAKQGWRLYMRRNLWSLSALRPKIFSQGQLLGSNRCTQQLLCIEEPISSPTYFEEGLLLADWRWQFHSGPT